MGRRHLRIEGEIKAHDQVIVGLLHEDVGHPGIFISGWVAKKGHTPIDSVLKWIERINQLYPSNAEQTSTDRRIRSELGAEPDQEPQLKVVSWLTPMPMRTR